MKEILVKDKDGTWKVWRDGQWLATEAPAPSAWQVDPVRSSISNGEALVAAKVTAPPPPPPSTSPSPLPMIISKPIPPQATPTPPTSAIVTPPPAIPPSITPPPVTSPPVTHPQPPAPFLAPASVKNIPIHPKVVQATSPAMTKPPAEDMTGRIEELTKKILREITVANFDADLRARLENIIRLRLREVRDTVDTRDALLRKKVDGGLELPPQTADEIIEIILRYLPQTHRPFIDLTEGKEVQDLSSLVSQMEAEISKMPPVVPSSTAKTTPSISALTPVAAPLPAAAIKPATVPTAEVKPSAAAVTAPSLTRSDSSVKPAAPPPQPPSAVASNQPLEPIIIKAPMPSRKPTMIDVHAKPSVVGPIDELKLFTIADFRRFDADPRRAAARLQEKIKLLEEESYAKMVEGVRAWRASPLNQLYVTVGQESLEGGKNVADAIRERREAGKTTLSEDEFGALLDLNKKLRF